MASNLRAADILGIDWESRARNVQPRETPAEPVGVLSYWPGGTFRLEPAEVPRKNVLNDPASWLNRGLSNLAGNAAEVILGRESGNSLVDLGAANVPGVGPAAILAAGGMPGLLDIAGAGELKNLSKIPKYTLEFVSRHFGERGLHNLDNALTRYPKAGKPSVNDALYIMRTGIGGEQVPAIVPYHSNDIMEDARRVIVGDEMDGSSFDELYNKFMDSELGHGPEGRYVAGLVENARENGDFKSALAANMLTSVRHQTPAGFAATRNVISEMKDDDFWHVATKSAQSVAEKFNLPSAKDNMRRMKELATSPTQDWERIIVAQERKDARDAEKALRKADKDASRETPRPQPVKPTEAPQPVQQVQAAPEVTVPVEAVPEVSPAITGGPNMWRENGWKSSQYSPNFFERFGSRLDENSKRDLFVLDSLKNHWVSQLGDPEGKGFSTADILNGLERADARHTKTNYDRISREFRKDIERNMESGNMPGTSIQYLQKFKNNLPVEGKTTPTLMLRMDEKPKVFMNPRVWADEAEGPDLYELLFRPAVDRKLNSLNPRYWEY